MLDQSMTEIRPLLLREQRHQILLDLDWVIVLGQTQPARQAMHVRINDHTFVLAEPRAQDHVGRLPGNAR